MSKTISASGCSTLIECYVLIAHCLVRVGVFQCMCQKGMTGLYTFNQTIGILCICVEEMLI